jgi:hypothetical protein
MSESSWVERGHRKQTSSGETNLATKITTQSGHTSSSKKHFCSDFRCLLNRKACRVREQARDDDDMMSESSWIERGHREQTLDAMRAWFFATALIRRHVPSRVPNKCPFPVIMCPSSRRFNFVPETGCKAGADPGRDARVVLRDCLNPQARPCSCPEQGSLSAHVPERVSLSDDYVYRKSVLPSVRTYWLEGNRVVIFTRNRDPNRNLRD